MSVVKFNCDYCGAVSAQEEAHYRRKKRHFCKRECYTKYRKEVLPQDEQHAWQGGRTADSRKRWYENNRAKAIAAAKARRLRELNAPGSHTKAEWEALKKANNYQCAEADDTCRGRITKDHKVPLIMGGSNDVSNLQILCGSHNSRKARKVYLGHFSAA